jgi:hypothetical protein
VVVRAGRPAARLDIYGEPGSETYFAAEALAWADRVVVGFGWAAYIVSPETGEVATLPLPCYFQAFRPAGASLLVLFGTGISRLDPPGVVAWQNDSLAVDGIEIDAVTEGRVQGRGEWDPPGRWRPFTVSLATGRAEDAPPLVA